MPEWAVLHVLMDVSLPLIARTNAQPCMAVRAMEKTTAFELTTPTKVQHFVGVFYRHQIQNL